MNADDVRDRARAQRRFRRAALAPSMRDEGRRFGPHQETIERFRLGERGGLSRPVIALVGARTLRRVTTVRRLRNLRYPSSVYELLDEGRSYEAVDFIVWVQKPIGSPERRKETKFGAWSNNERRTRYERG